MVRYLKLIVIIFGSIGLIIGAFFYLQNQNDINIALQYKDRLDYAFLKKQCQNISKDTVYPCLKDEFTSYLRKVSLTGTSIGMKFVFNIMDEDKDSFKIGKEKHYVDVIYLLNYLEINNLALGHFYKKYYGFSFLYGGFIASLARYTEKGYRFSQDIITGLEGPKGLILLKEHAEYGELMEKFSVVKANYYKTKQDIEVFIENERKRLGVEP